VGEIGDNQDYTPDITLVAAAALIGKLAWAPPYLEWPFS